MKNKVPEISEIVTGLEAMNGRRRRKKLWTKIVSILSAIVVFVTMYALVLPAITQSVQVFCGLEEHTHSADCYADKNSDLEDSSIWEASVASVNLSGKKRDDVIEIAESQLGYAGKGAKTLRKSRRYRSPTTPCALNRCTSRSLFSSPRYLFSLRSC